MKPVLLQIRSQCQTLLLLCWRLLVISDDYYLNYNVGGYNQNVCNRVSLGLGCFSLYSFEGFFCILVIAVTLKTINYDNNNNKVLFQTTEYIV